MATYRGQIIDVIMFMGEPIPGGFIDDPQDVVLVRLAEDNRILETRRGEVEVVTVPETWFERGAKQYLEQMRGRNFFAAIDTLQGLQTLTMYELRKEK